MNAKIISLEKCKEVMLENGIEYAEEELIFLREFLYRLLDITSSHYYRIKEKEAKIIDINKTDHETKSIPLYPSEHRRAS